MASRTGTWPVGRAERRLAGWLLAVLVALLVEAPTAHGAQARCQLGRIVEFPITMRDLRPMMTAQINDVPVQFLVDSGAFFSMLTPASAAELKLATTPAPFGFYLIGFAGTASVEITRVKTFTLAGVPIHNVQFLVGGGDLGAAGMGLLGQNVLHLADVEYDLGQGAVRLMQAEHCENSVLAYWAGTQMPYSAISISRTTRENPHTMGHAFLNGHEIRVMFDTGAGSSVLSLKAAARAGVRRDSPGVEPGGQDWGIGRTVVQSYIAPFASFKLGEEEIRNTRLRIADVDLPDADMLLGADFFLSHRIYVANKLGKLFFTYNGGAVFNLSAGGRAAGAQSTPAAPTPAAAATEDAADLARRGAAFASRREFDQAITALTRACELAPDRAEYFYERGVAYWESKQAALARTDFDRALELKPDQVEARVARAELLLQSNDGEGAAKDLDAADAAASKESEVRFTLGQDYERAQRFESALKQWNEWITYHGVDAKVPIALLGRCTCRAMIGIELPLALKDCDAALHHAPRGSATAAVALSARAVTLLRLGEYDRSIVDYDESLKISPKNPIALYGRGIAELRKQRAAQGQADLEQARALAPQVAEEFERRGIAP